MRISAHAHSFLRAFYSLLFFLGLGGIIFMSLALPVSAQYTQPSTTVTQQTSTSSPDYRSPNFESDVPHNNHTYTQAVVIDLMSAIMCQLTGIDLVTKQYSCLGVNPITGKMGYATNQEPAQFGQVQNTEPRIGGALGSVSNYVALMFTPTISSSQYGNYLASNFGIVKTANAGPAAPPTPFGVDCQNSTLGYGFCGLQPVFNLWVVTRDIAYAILVIAFVFLGLGVMLRFKVDPRTVMSLQNQIPRVIIAILLITFSYGIAGMMVDLMWTITYTGINAIASSSPKSIVREGCADDGAGETLQQAANGKILDQPISFANRIYQPNCNEFNSGIVYIAGQVGNSFNALIVSIIESLLGWESESNTCDLFNFDNCIVGFVSLVTDWIIQMIIAVAILIALFRLWFELIKAYVTFFIFVIMGPVWIVMGLIPGRPLGFEKWLRLIFANLAAFPLVAFILVFARVIVDAVPLDPAPDPKSVFIPPLVGNPNAVAFNALLAFGAILIAPTIPSMIREKMKVPQNKLGATAAAGVAAATGAVTAPATKAWKSMNRRNAQSGAPEGVLSVARHRIGNTVAPIRWARRRAADRRRDYNDQRDRNEV